MKRGIKEMNIILASGSPRRKELLAQAGFDFEVEVSNADENVAEESPTEMEMCIRDRMCRLLITKEHRLIRLSIIYMLLLTRRIKMVQMLLF